MISIFSSFIQEFGRVGTFSLIASSAFLIAGGIFTNLFYHEFFIGEKPKEWLLVSLGLILSGALLPLNYLSLQFKGILSLILTLMQLIGPILIFIGSMLVYEKSERVF